MYLLTELSRKRSISAKIIEGLGSRFKSSNMNKLKFLFSTILTLFFELLAQQKSNANYYTYKNECLEKTLDGDYIIKGWEMEVQKMKQSLKQKEM